MLVDLQFTVYIATYVPR